MVKLTFAQMRRSIGRLTAAGIAIVIGTAFVAATLLASDVLKRASFDAVAARLGSADLVVNRAEGLSLRDLDVLAAVDGVAVADPLATANLELTVGDKTVYQTVVGVRSDPRLQPLTVTSGAFPTADDQIALPETSAEILGVAVGGTVVERSYLPVVSSTDETVDGTGTGDATEEATPDASDEAVTEPTVVERTFTVVGIVADRMHAYDQSGGAGVVSDAVLESAAVGAMDGAVDPVYGAALVLLSPGADTETVREGLASALDGSTVSTKDEAAGQMVDSITGDQSVFTVAILAFAAIALVVASLVVANTFQVIVAQRTRTLALLRCVGADKGQLRRSVVLEAATLGLVASAAGLALGALLVQVAVMVLGRADLSVPIPSTITFTLSSVLWPVVVGTLVTILSSLVPARAATRVAPLEALRPSDVPATGSSAGQTRLWASGALVLGGVALMGGAVTLSSSAGVELAMLAGVVGGAASFVGILLSSVYWMPKVVTVVGRLLGRSGPSAQLAAANISRNPRRTAATSTALLIGVTLVSMMSVGAATARTSMMSTLDEKYDVDVVASNQQYTDDGPEALPGTLVAELGDVTGVAAVTTASERLVSVTVPGAPAHGADEDWRSQVTFVDRAGAAQVLRSVAGTFDRLEDSTIILSSVAASSLGVESGSVVELGGTASSIAVKVEVVDLMGYRIYGTAALAQALTGEFAPTEVWFRLASIDDAAAVVARITDTASSASVWVSGPAVERASMQQVIDVVLAVIVGLLAIAVVIALIGVANTLSLSVLERRRESATLRAIGLSKRQLRTTLAIEGMLIAGVGAVIGVVLGLLYGWVGSLVLLAEFADVRLTVPLLDVALMIVVAVAFGLLASVLPARAAAKTSPVEALAVG